MRVEIWSDIVCPWCWLGKRRFELALASFPKKSGVEIVWRSFELAPDAPRERPGTVEDWLIKERGMPRAQLDAIHGRLVQFGNEVGLDYHFDRVRPSNSFDAHRLVHHARTKNLVAEMQDRLMRANFSEGARIGDRDTLASLARDVGIDDAAAVLAGDAFSEEVRADEARAHELGIGGVPCFVADEALAVSGAQDVAVFAGFLERAASAL